MYDILNELKRRKVFRAAMAYAIVAWLMVQVSTAIFPVFEAPPWVLRALVLFIAVGFPLVLILAWAYDLTPDGLQRTAQSTSSGESGWRSIDSILVIALVVALGVTTMSPPVSRIFSAEAESVGSDGDAASSEAAGFAVMPLAAVNSDGEAIQLADGFAESLHWILQDVDALAVIGMASSIRMADDRLSHVEIFEDFGIDYVIEGSMRVNNGDISVFAQLVQLPEGETAWSAEFSGDDGELESVLHAIANGVSEELGVATQNTQSRTGLPPDAFVSWLKVLGLLRHGSEPDLGHAQVLAEALVARAPTFGPGHAALALTLAARSASDTMDLNRRLAAVDELLSEASTLAPESVQVLMWLAQSRSLLMRWRGSGSDLEKIDDLFERALRAAPKSADLFTAYAEHKLAWGDTMQATVVSQRAIEMDPMSTVARKVRVEALIRSGRREVAEAEIAALEDMGDLAPRMRAQLDLSRGNLQEALDSYAEIAERGGDVPLAAVNAWATIGDRAHASRIVDLLEPPPLSEIWQLALDGRYADAFDFANTQMQATEPATVLLIGVLATQSERYEAATEMFSRCFADWIRDTGPLHGETALRYAPWFAKALIEAGREDDGRRLLDRHLAGLIAAEAVLSDAQLGLYFAANYATLGRLGDAQKALERAIDDGFRLTFGALGGPVDLTESVILGDLEFTAAQTQQER